jgi:hypothetical protein
LDPIIATAIAGAVPTLAIIAAFVRNETALANVNARIETLTRDMNARFETLTRRIDSVDTDLREWAKITMLHNTDIARLKDKTGL